jgi:hypothetical protein
MNLSLISHAPHSTKILWKIGNYLITVCRLSEMLVGAISVASLVTEVEIRTENDKMVTLSVREYIVWCLHSIQ